MSTNSSVKKAAKTNNIPYLSTIKNRNKENKFSRHFIHNFNHLLTLEDLSKTEIETILDNAKPYAQALTKTSVPKKIKYPNLSGSLVMNLFFEPSTRTLTTFAIAATRLSADVQSLNIASSSTAKGETILDTVANLIAMGADYFIIRHPQSGAAKFVADFINLNYQSQVHVINAGDGCNAHPTQALLDLYTIIQSKPKIDQISVAIIGDILHSRVARSDIMGLIKLGVKDIRLIAPATLIPPAINQWFESKSPITIDHNLDQAIKGVDVIIMLRLQKERMQAQFIPSSEEYFKYYGLTTKRLAQASSNALVMHPGPINRGIEISSRVAENNKTTILNQVTNGIAIRMSILALMQRIG